MQSYDYFYNKWLYFKNNTYICSKIATSIHLNHSEMKTEFRKENQNFVMAFEGRRVMDDG